MEIIFEVLFTLLLEGCFDIVSNKKINIIIRIVILGMVSLFYFGLIIFFAMFLIKAELIVVKIIFTLVIILILALLIKLWLKIYKSKAIK